MTYTAQQVSAAFDAFEGSDEYSDFEYAGSGIVEELASRANGYPKNDGTVEIPGLGTVTLEAYHGGDGDGSETYLVIGVGDQLFRTTGYYSSWDSNGWDGGWQEVESYVEPVTFYRTKK